MLQKAFNNHKYIYPELMAMRPVFLGNILYINMIENPFICKSNFLKQFLNLHQEFVDYSHQDKVYKQFTKREKKMFEKFINYRGENSLIKYISYKTCKISQESLTVGRAVWMDPFFWDINSTKDKKTKKLLKRIKNEQ